VISGRTALYAVVGHPVGHSLSPAMHNAAFAALGLDAAYVALDVEEGRLQEGLRGAHALGFRGLNVTVPHKRRAAEACLSLDPVARLCGAVNTLRRAEGGWEGFNTDAPATLALLEAAGVRAGARALLLGAGGASRAGAWALLQAGCSVYVAARRPEPAVELAQAMAAAFPHGKVAAISWYAAATACAECEVLVNGTSIGLGGQAEALPPVAFRAGQVAVDFVYGDTAFARGALAAGARLVTGEQILVRQGALAFALWTGQPAPEPTMAQALQRAAGGARR
jgi:shikimate dehydrogenase